LKSNGFQQLPLGSAKGAQCALPTDYEPAPPPHFDVQRVYLAKGSLSTPARRRFVERICALYPHAEVLDRTDTPHNRIDLGEPDPAARNEIGKRTLLFGEHKSPVRFSEEQANTCPNYWHFSVYGYCPFGCKYCYLAGTPGVWHSPTVKVFVNIEDMLAQVDAVARRAAKPTAFYLGKLQDGLALDPLSAYSTVLVPFFARHPCARQIMLTKSASVERLCALEHGGHTILSWSLNPPEVVERFAENVPSADERLVAMRRCAEAGYPVRAVLMPVIPVRNWRSIYAEFLRRVLRTVPIGRLTLGGICSYANARRLMQERLGPDNAVSAHFEKEKSADGRLRYAPELRTAMYAHLIGVAREVRPDVELALCLEEPAVWRALDLHHRLGRCNCVL